MRTAFQCIVHHPSYGVLTNTTVLSEKSFQRIQESSRIRQCQENPGNREDEICSKLPNEFLSLRSSSVMASWQSVRDCIATWIFSTLTYLPPFLPPSDSPKRRKFKRNTIFVNLKAQLASRRNCCSKKSAKVVQAISTLFWFLHHRRKNPVLGKGSSRSSLSPLSENNHYHVAWINHNNDDE